MLDGLFILHQIGKRGLDIVLVGLCDVGGVIVEPGVDSVGHHCAGGTL